MTKLIVPTMGVTWLPEGPSFLEIAKFPSCDLRPFYAFPSHSFSLDTSPRTA